jgi:hypothetical protein
MFQRGAERGYYFSLPIRYSFKGYPIGHQPVLVAEYFV